MKTLVTGGSGFIGSHVVDKLIEAGHEVRVFDLKEPHRKDVEFLRGDIISKGDINKAMKNMEAVYHIAAFSNIDLVKDNPLTTIEYNILGTAYLLEECRKEGIKRFIFASSVYVYEEKGHLYTTSKLASEMICKNYNALYGLPYTILRYGTAYGPRSRNLDVISIFVKRALEGEKMVIFGSGDQRRHFIYIEDLAEGNLAALQDIAKNQTYNLGGMRPITIKEVAETVKKLIGNVAIEYKEARAGDYEGTIVSNEKVKTGLAWQLKVDFEEGLRRYIQWYKVSVR